ncbi:MAG TPA: alpha/beta fold hydrolase [Gemmataceae bacterium]|nr:alpha/beta fold hydrolase [Gemmataceae bacterium]
MKRFLRSRRIRRLGFALGLLVVLWLLSSLLMVYWLTSRPHARFDEPVPAVAWGRLEPQRLLTADGLGIGAWFAAGPDNGPSILLLHGNRGSRRNSLSNAAVFAEEGCSVLLLSLRAHGDSDGEQNDLGYSARQDVAAAVEFLERRRPGRPIVIQGTSLGAAAAIFAGPELGTRVTGYVLESPYRDLRTAARNRLQAYLPPLLDEIAYAGAKLVCPLILPDVDRIAPVESLGKIPPTIPILILAGSIDNRALPEEARDLHERVASHGRLVFFEGAGHHSLRGHNPTLYREKVRQLLRAVVQGR